jgi:dipeptidyl aminopeptidase/acylaminoacyl peptidase
MGFRLACPCLILLAAPLCLGASGPEDRQMTDPQSVVSASNPAARPVPIDDLYYTRSVFDPAWSPDGRQVVFTTDMSGRFNLWKVSAGGGWPIQLTQSDDVQSGAVWSPDGKWIVFQQDHAGNEMHDLYAIPGDGGEVVNLTNTDQIREVGPRWSPDGKSLAIAYKPKASSVVDIALLDWQTRQVRPLTYESARDRLWAVAAWSPDGKVIYANRGQVGGTDSDVYSIDVASGTTENLTPHSGQVRHNASSLSPDGKTLLVTSNQKGGYQNVALLDLSTKKLSWVTDTNWEAFAEGFSPDGRFFTYGLNEDGRTEAYLVEGPTGHAERISLPEGLNFVTGNPTAFAPQGDRLLVSHESSTQPGDLYVYDIAGRRATQLTSSSVASLRSAQLPPSQIVHYGTFDGKIISALLWMPFNLKRDGSNPALVIPHGGPTGQMVDYWNTDVAALASRGYICIAPNVRGSTGYGMEFQKANHQDLGGGDLKDELHAVDFLKATGYVDPKKIGITGGSYGGFMTLMAIGKAPEVWSAAVERYGIISWLTMLKHSDPLLNQYLRSLLGDPEEDRKVYEAASPISFIRDAKAPLLVLQGDNDIRVPREEAEQVVEILKGEGRTVEAHYYANEGHGFDKRENQIDAIRRTVEWFDRYLKAKD